MAVFTFPSIEYTWTDAQSKKMKIPASQYVDFMATSIQNTLNDETLFPTKAGKVWTFSYSQSLFLAQTLFLLMGHWWYRSWISTRATHGGTKDIFTAFPSICAYLFPPLRKSVIATRGRAFQFAVCALYLFCKGVWSIGQKGDATTARVNRCYGKEWRDIGLSIPQPNRT